MSLLVHRQQIASDRDLVDVRARAMAIAAELGFATREQTQIATALSEIGRNAIAHAGNGEIQFALDPEEAPRQLTMRVTDKGPGIPAEVLPKIFQPYFTTKGPRHGTGLGLNIVQRLVKEGNGALHVKTFLGQGSTFSVYLPGIDLPKQTA